MGRSTGERAEPRDGSRRGRGAATPLSGENCVRLVGRVSAAPEARELPSGDRLVTFRLVVPRPPAAMAHSGVSVDTFDCAVWKPALQQRVLRWEGGESVSLAGALRRRFWRGVAGAASRTEVEVDRAALVRAHPARSTDACEDG